MVPVKVKKLHDGATIPKYARYGDAGFDLVAVEDTIVYPSHTGLVRTGLAFEIPDGYEIQVRPRSGISAKTRLRVSNAPGTIDSGFRGEVKVIIDNLNPMVTNVEDFKPEIKLITGWSMEMDESYPKGAYLICKGDRIAQGVLAEVPIADFELVDELDETERGTGGFGSSGVSTL
ncbi:dUTP diphosphatase [Brevibacillus nitrificans]|uniref:dUTP diphosphatase n=1 Tax=Brevibacillus nitrificans TaxID=651560 RepID=UPI00286328B7|nr:dUTP diphosphatase [Brevibacillus nitrificans]MDR7318894.1 dUTP pyrophosphatase [Brevibacillus nitrificans]